jgi:UDP-N-acetylglucosamine 2-epimerase (non-hydrolysing)
MRDVTERPEGTKAGVARLVGTSEESIVHETVQLLRDPARYRAMSRGHNPYGDGTAARQIVQVLERTVCGKIPSRAPARRRIRHELIASMALR